MPGLTLAAPLGQALRLALESHPALAQRRGEIDAAGFDIKSAEWKRYPTLTVERSQLLGRQPVITTNSNQGAQTIRVEQRLYTFGRITSEIDAATLRQQGAEWALVETEQDLLTRVVGAYMELVRQSARLRIAGRNIDEHQRLVDLIQRRRESGVSSDVDAALAQARLAQARAEQASFRAAALNARVSLEQLAGAPLPGDPETPRRAERLKWSDAARALDQAAGFSPTLKRLAANVDLAETDVRARNAAIYPEVVGRYERFNGSAQVIPFDRWMVVLQYQPGAGLSQVPLIDAARRRVEAATSGLEAGRRDLTERVFSQYNEARSLLEQIEPARGYQRASADVMDSYLRQYTAGRKTWQEVLNAQRELTQAGYALVDTESATTAAFLKLDVLTGELARANVLGRTGAVGAAGAGGATGAAAAAGADSAPDASPAHPSPVPAAPAAEVPPPAQPIPVAPVAPVELGPVSSTSSSFSAPPVSSATFFPRLRATQSLTQAPQ